MYCVQSADDSSISIAKAILNSSQKGMSLQEQASLFPSCWVIPKTSSASCTLAQRRQCQYLAHKKRHRSKSQAVARASSLAPHSCKSQEVSISQLRQFAQFHRFHEFHATRHWSWSTDTHPGPSCERACLVARKSPRNKGGDEA